MERTLIKNKDKIEPSDLASILRSFSKIRDNKMSGSDKFFNEMEELVIKNLDKFNHDEFGEVIYAYSVRDQGTPEFHKLVVSKIKENMPQYTTYKQMSNIAWYLLFTDMKDKDFWQYFISQFETIQGKLPLLYYRPFKIIAYLLETFFPENTIDLFEFKDRFYYAEQYYIYAKNEKFFDQDKRYAHFRSLIVNRMGLMPMDSTCFDNLFLLNLYWETKRMGINIFFERDYVPKSEPIRLNGHAKMHSKMMSLNEWIILDLAWDDYVNIGNQDQRDQFIQNWYDKTSEIQIKKGIQQRFSTHPGF